MRCSFHVNYTENARLMPDDVADLEDHLGYWLRFVSNHVSRAFSRKVSALGVSVAEWVVLREAFERAGVVPSNLADRLGMTRGAISKIVDRLIDKGLVTRTQSQDDRRYQAIALTPAGKELVPRLAALANENDAAFFGHLSASERRTLENLMRDIVRRHGLHAVPIE